MGAQLRVVRRRIRSVQSTMKITRAMELIASSRIVKAQQRVEAARPYAIQLTQAMEDVAAQAGSVAHPLLEDREQPAKVGVLVVTSDRGLAGSYNSNVLKIGEQQIESIRARGLEPVLYVSGKKGVGYFRFRAVPIHREWQGHSEVPTYEVAQEVGHALIRDFADQEIDELHCVYTDFRSAFTLRATHQRFLPIAPEEVTGTGGNPAAEYLYEPGPERDPRPPAAAVRDHQGLRRDARVRGLRERGSPPRHEGGDRQRGGAHQDLHPAGQPRPPGRDHHRDQ